MSHMFRSFSRDECLDETEKRTFSRIIFAYLVCLNKQDGKQDGIKMVQGSKLLVQGIKYLILNKF